MKEVNGELFDSNQKQDIVFIFKEILNKFSFDDKSCDLNLDLRRNLLEIFNDLLNNISPNYVPRVNFGRANIIVKYPVIKIIDTINRDQNSSILLNYVFNCVNKKIYVILKPDINKNKFNKYIESVKNLFFEENYEFIQCENNLFKDSIILKKYSLDDLDNYIIKKDLKKFINLFEKVNYIYNDSPSSHVVSDFNQILNKYETEKNKSIKASFFASKIQNNFAKDVYDFVKNIVNNPNIKYSVKSSIGVNSWANMPVISIVNDDIFDSYQEGLHINYTFNTKSSKVYLSINPKSKNNDQYFGLKNLLIEKLKKSNFNLSSDLIIGDNTIDEYSILLKEYNKSDINESTLIKDMEYFLSLYPQLCNVYLDNKNSDFSTVEFESSGSKNVLESIINNKSELNSVMNYTNNPFKFFNVYKYLNDINEVEVLFNDENLDKLNEFNFTYDDYKNIISSIIDSFNQSLTDIFNKYSLNDYFEELSTCDQIIIFAKSFTKVKYKSLGTPLGYLSFNTINIEDRLPAPLIITTIIHELSHFLLSEILEQIVMKVLNTNRTPLIESYVFIMLQEDLWYLLDEFCAHTVEGRFAPYKYQDYGSYEYKLKEVSKANSKQDINFSLAIANTFARDIKTIFEHFIVT